MIKIPMIMNEPIEIKEYSVVSPTQGSAKIRGMLNGLQLEVEDHKIQEYLRKKNILVVKELKDGLEISAKSYIGKIQFKNFIVNVKPKFKLKLENISKLFAYSLKLDDIKMPDNEIISDIVDNHLIDVIITFFVRECRKLAIHGLLKSYVTYRDDIRYLRGKIILTQQQKHIIRKNLNFACEFDELEYNNLENQILLNCLKKCYNLTNSESLKKQLMTLIYQFSGEVCDVYISLEDFHRINYTRLNQHYKTAHELARMILSSIGIGDFYQPLEPPKQKITSFFVDMNLVFERFVTRLLLKNPRSYTVESQKSSPAWESENGEKRFVRPDILLTNDSEVKVVVDVKYKPKLDTSDLYQIGFYVHEHKLQNGFVIFPAESEVKLKAREWKSTNQFTNQFTNQSIKIFVKTVDVDNALRYIYNSDEESDKQLEELVAELISESP